MDIFSSRKEICKSRKKESGRNIRRFNHFTRRAPPSVSIITSPRLKWDDKKRIRNLAENAQVPIMRRSFLQGIPWFDMAGNHYPDEVCATSRLFVRSTEISSALNMRCKRINGCTGISKSNSSRFILPWSSAAPHCVNDRLFWNLF